MRADDRSPWRPTSTGWPSSSRPSPAATGFWSIDTGPAPRSRISTTLLIVNKLDLGTGLAARRMVAIYRGARDCRRSAVAADTGDRHR